MIKRDIHSLLGLRNSLIENVSQMEEFIPRKAISSRPATTSLKVLTHMVDVINGMEEGDLLEAWGMRRRGFMDVRDDDTFSDTFSDTDL